jgi:hypothetical protein
MCLLSRNVNVEVCTIGVVIESAYFLLGSPACTALVDRDHLLRPVLVLRGLLVIIRSLPNKNRCLQIRR